MDTKDVPYPTPGVQVAEGQGQNHVRAPENAYM